jgi:hypothetical protein
MRRAIKAVIGNHICKPAHTVCIQTLHNLQASASTSAADVDRQTDILDPAFSLCHVGRGRREQWQ